MPQLRFGTAKQIKTNTAIFLTKGFPGGASGKELSCQCRRHKRHRFDPWVGRIPWRRAWQPTPVFLPGQSYGQRSLWWATVHRVAKSQTGLKQLSMHTFALQGNHYVFFIHDSQSALYVVSVQEYLLTILRVFD